MKNPKPICQSNAAALSLRRKLWNLVALASFTVIALAQPVAGQDTNAGLDATPSPDPTALPTNSLPENPESADSGAPSTQNVQEDDQEMTWHEGTGVNREAVIAFGKDAVLKTNESAEAVVIIGGSAKIHGKVRDAVVVIGGDIEIDGEARDVVAILGSIKAGSGARLRGDVVAIGGSVDIADGVKPRRKPVALDLGGLTPGIRNWIIYCLFRLRPLAPQVGWVWVVAGLFFLVYLIIALVLPGPVRVCAAELTRRPATSFFMGLLAKMLLPIVYAILVATGIGILVVPFIAAAVMFGAMVGKVALFEALGFGAGRRLNSTLLQSPLIAFLCGIIFITILYVIPILGLLALGLVSVWGLGGAVTAAFGAFKREKPEKPTPPPAPESGPAAGAPEPGTPEPSAPEAAAMAGSATPGNLPESLSLRRASFWERMGAGFLDFVLVGILSALVQGRPPLAFLIAVVYFTILWTWKGTTVGGIILGIKVVRLDGQPLTMIVALVRSLSAAFSIIVLFLGFLWIGWDKEKQGWHDRIAGTVVVHHPRGLPLVCV